MFTQTPCVITHSPARDLMRVVDCHGIFGMISCQVQSVAGLPAPSPGMEATTRILTATPATSTVCTAAAPLAAAAMTTGE